MMTDDAVISKGIVVSSVGAAVSATVGALVSGAFVSICGNVTSPVGAVVCAAVAPTLSLADAAGKNAKSTSSIDRIKIQILFMTITKKFMK